MCSSRRFAWVPILIFLTKKKFQFFFWEWGIKKSKIFFWFNDVKLPEKFICDIQFVEKCSIRGVLTKFCRKVPFWGLYWPLNYFSHTPLNLSTNMALFKIIIFLIKKVAKLVETQKFCHHRLEHLFLHWGSYSQFVIWWILRKLVFLVLFWGVSNEKLFVTPPGKNWKKITWTCCTSYQKIVQKDVSSFSRKSEKLSKSGPYLGCCNGKAHICDQVSLAMCVFQIIWNLFCKKKICLYHLCLVRN